MLPDYSIFPAAPGTIKPEKKPYANVSLSALYDDAIKKQIQIGPAAGYTELHKYPQRLLQAVDFQELIKNDKAPIPATEDRELYHGDRHLDWWFSGLTAWLFIKDYYGQHRGSLQPGSVFFELGCATGRVLRHPLFQDPGLKILGCDLNARHVDWVQKFLPQKARVFQNSAYPCLPLPDNSIDLGVACSVFTHIDDMESSWLMELRRIMKPGALFFITFMSEKFWMKCGSHPAWSWNVDTFLKLNCEIQLTRESFASPMPQPKVVLAWPHAVYNTVVFHHTDYVRRVWGRYLDIMDILEAPFDFQDLAILAKPWQAQPIAPLCNMA